MRLLGFGPMPLASYMLPGQDTKLQAGPKIRLSNMLPMPDDMASAVPKIRESYMLPMPDDRLRLLRTSERDTRSTASLTPLVDRGDGNNP